MDGSPTNALAGRVPVITGAGFGRGCAISLASAGASVVVNDIDPAGADKTVAAIHDLGGEAVARVADVKGIVITSSCKRPTAFLVVVLRRHKAGVRRRGADPRP